MKKDDELLINLRISPNASRNEIIKEADGRVKVKITAAPVEGKANKCLTEFLSKSLKLPKTSIEIVRGETSKEKTLLIKNLDDNKIKLIKDMLFNKE